MVKRLETTIRLEYDHASTAAAIARAVSPENLKSPPGLSVKTTQEGCFVVTVVKGEVEVLTFIATVDDLLSSVCIAEKALNVLKGR